MLNFDNFSLLKFLLNQTLTPRLAKLRTRLVKGSTQIILSRKLREWYAIHYPHTKWRWECSWRLCLYLDNYCNSGIGLLDGFASGIILLMCYKCFGYHYWLCFEGHSPITREEMTLQDRESVSPSNQGGAIIHVVGFCYWKNFSYLLFYFYITSRGYIYIF